MSTITTARERILTGVYMESTTDEEITQSPSHLFFLFTEAGCHRVRGETEIQSTHRNHAYAKLRLKAWATQWVPETTDVDVDAYGRLIFEFDHGSQLTLAELTKMQEMISLIRNSLRDVNTERRLTLGRYVHFVKPLEESWCEGGPYAIFADIDPMGEPREGNARLTHLAEGSLWMECPFERPSDDEGDEVTPEKFIELFNAV